MNFWRKNSEKNLFEFSTEKENFKKAIEEWEFSGVMEDYGSGVEDCELCEKDGLRYHFEIINRGTGNGLMVGSKCIEKFDIKVFDEFGLEVTGNKDRYLKERLKKQHVIDKIKELANLRRKGKIKEHSYAVLDVYCMDEFNSTGKLTPKMLNYLIKGFEENGIEFTPKFFKVDLRSDFNKSQLFKLDEIQFARIRKSLTHSQLLNYNKRKGLM